MRIILDDVFGEENFRSEIIWNYKRWSTSKKGLLPGHQTIFFYSKTNKYKFNVIYTEYSPTTNVDQILQEREEKQLIRLAIMGKLFWLKRKKVYQCQMFGIFHF